MQKLVGGGADQIAIEYKKIDTSGRDSEGARIGGKRCCECWRGVFYDLTAVSGTGGVHRKC